MSLLSADAHAGAIAQLEAPEDVEVSHQQESNAREAERNAEPDVKTEVEDSSDFTRDTRIEEEDTGSHQVPYSRFKQVNDSRKELQSSQKELERQILELQSKLENKGNERQVDSYPDDDDTFSDIFDGEDDYDPKYTQLEQRLQRFEQQQVERELESELNHVMKNHPEVPEAILLEAIVKNPHIELNTVANAYKLWTAEIEESAIARYVNQNGGKPSVPKRMSGLGGSGPSGVSQKPRTLEEASAAAREYLKQNW